MTPQGLHRIADDLEEHVWYEQLVRETVRDAQAYAARWAAFEEFVAARKAAAD
jgi:hypothetical protein